LTSRLQPERRSGEDHAALNVPPPWHFWQPHPPGRHRPPAHSTVSVLMTQLPPQSLYDILMHPDEQIETIIAPSTIPALDIRLEISMAKLEPSLSEKATAFRLQGCASNPSAPSTTISLSILSTLGLKPSLPVAATLFLIPIQALILPRRDGRTSSIHR